jgi:hypothetical protein
MTRGSLENNLGNEKNNLGNNLGISNNLENNLENNLGEFPKTQDNNNLGIIPSSEVIATKTQEINPKTQDSIPKTQEKLSGKIGFQYDVNAKTASDSNTAVNNYKQEIERKPQIIRVVHIKGVPDDKVQAYINTMYETAKGDVAIGMLEICEGVKEKYKLKISGHTGKQIQGHLKCSGVIETIAGNRSRIIADKAELEFA